MQEEKIIQLNDLKKDEEGLGSSSRRGRKYLELLRVKFSLKMSIDLNEVFRVTEGERTRKI